MVRYNGAPKPHYPQGPIMANRVDNVLFLCTGNSARSVMAEAILSRLGEGRFRAFSAGARPAGDIHPETRALLQSLGYRTEGLGSKGWEEFSGGDCAAMDLERFSVDRRQFDGCKSAPSARRGARRDA